MELQDPWALKDPKDLEVPLAKWVYLDNKGLEGLKVLRAKRETDLWTLCNVMPVREVSCLKPQELRVCLDLQDLRDPRVQKEKKAKMALKEKEETFRFSILNPTPISFKVLLGLKDPLAPRDLRASEVVEENAEKVAKPP